MIMAATEKTANFKAAIKSGTHDIDSLNYQTEIWLRVAKNRAERDANEISKDRQTEHCLKAAVRSDMAAERKHHSAQLLDKLGDIQEQMSHDRQMANIVGKTLAAIKSLAEGKQKNKSLLGFEPRTSC